MSNNDKTFAQWRENLDNFDDEARHTVECVLKVVKSWDSQEDGKKLADLTTLDLSDQEIKDLTPLSELTNLVDLCLFNNQVTDLSSISRLTNLIELNLSHNQITDLTPLCNLNKITYLWLGDNKISDLSGLKTLNNIVYLGLANNKISDLSGLKKLINLSYLSLSNNIICDLKPLGKLHKLSYLWLNHNQISDLSPLCSLNELTELWLDDNPLTDLSILSNKKGLSYLHWEQVFFPKKYWSVPLVHWQPEWILSEKNTELKRVLIKTIGYEKISQELKTLELDAWREYTLLKIPQSDDDEHMSLLKMTCPSTEHIHVLRVPPEISLAREAVRWVNWGIDPEDFVIET